MERTSCYHEHCAGYLLSPPLSFTYLLPIVTFIPSLCSADLLSLPWGCQQEYLLVRMVFRLYGRWEPTADGSLNLYRAIFLCCLSTTRTTVRLATQCPPSRKSCATKPRMEMPYLWEGLLTSTEWAHYIAIICPRYSTSCFVTFSLLAFLQCPSNSLTFNIEIG